MFYVYIIRSAVDGRLYKGVSENIERRLLEHNAGKTKSTRPYKPWTLVYFEKFDNFEEARKREKFFKSGTGRTFLKKILDP